MRLTVYATGRELEVAIDTKLLTLQATNETGNPAIQRSSRTWNFDHDGKHYRVQVQVTG